MFVNIVKWFKVLLFNLSNSIYQVFLSNTKNLHPTVYFQFEASEGASKPV